MTFSHRNVIKNNKFGVQFYIVRGWSFLLFLSFFCIGEPAPQKTFAKQTAATKLLEMLSTRYVFLEVIEEKSLIPGHKISKMSDKISKETLQKWTNSCGRCFQRGHLAQN